jgi:hypothetical protein
VDEGTNDNKSFTLSEGETTLGPFRGEGWIVAQNAQHLPVDTTLDPEQIGVAWNERPPVNEERNSDQKAQPAGG